MGLLTLTVRATGVEPFTVEIDDDETVESLAVVIFSLRPDMGEDLRVAHRGRPLRPAQLLKDAGMASGDVVAVARRPAQPAQPAAAAVAAAEEGAPPSVPEPPTEKIAESAAPPATAPDASLVPVPGESVEAAEVADAEEAGKAVAEQEDKEEEAGAPAEAVDAEAGTPEAVAAEDNTLEEGAPSAVLLALAQRLDEGAGDAHPGELAATLRRTAARVQALEAGISEFGQALQMVNLISAHALQGAGSQPDGTAGGRLNSSAPSPGETPKSFLVKRGDVELQEAHRQALRQPELKRQTSGGSTSSGGALSTGAALTREEMDKARRARLEQLEAQQAQKKREQEEAVARAKAKEAMFQQPFVGPNKPLGKF